jgi:peptide deformylase
MILNLVTPNDSVLKQVAEPFNFDNPQMDPTELFHNLRDTMCQNNGIGLAAPQVGIPLRVFVIGNPADPDSAIPVFNPKIVDFSELTVPDEEGCLTFPGLYIRIKRSRTIRARYTTHENVTDTIKFDGLTARAFQHEYDHLDGVLYLNRANRYHIDRAKRQKSKMDKLRAKNVGRY